MDGLTPLHLAVKGADLANGTRLVRYLLMRGASKEIFDNSNMRPVDYSKEIKSVDIRN